MDAHSATTHRLVLGDARHLEFLPDGCVHLVVTSPPYWTLKEYLPNPGQLGHLGKTTRYSERPWNRYGGSA